MQKLFHALLALALFSSYVVLMTRHRTEQQLKRVELALDLKDTKELAFVTGEKLPDVLRRFKEEGVTSIGVAETTLSELLDEGRAVEIQGSALPRFKMDERQAGKIKKFAKLKFGSAVFKEKENGELIFFVPSRKELMNLPLGLPPDTVDSLHELGFSVVPRYENFATLNARDLYKIFVETAESPAQHETAFVFSGMEVLGFKALLKDVGSQISANHFKYGLVEFGKQKGDAALARFCKPYVVRVHSIQRDEMNEMTIDEAAERFVRAVKERGVRLLYIRPFLTFGAGVDGVEYNAEYVREIKVALQKSGYTFGFAPVLPEVSFSPLFKIFLIAGILSGVFLFLQFFTGETDPKRTGISFVIALLLCSLIWFKLPLLTEKALALLAAIVFPTLAFFKLYETAKASPVEPPQISFLRSMSLFLRTTFFTLCGAFLCAALLTRWEFMMHVDQFAGVKLAHAMPIVFVFTLYAFEMKRKEKEERAFYLFRLFDAVKSFLSAPLKIGYAALACVLFGVIMLALLRTGNEPGFGVSPHEMKLRGILEGLLYARPRTKEFLIGHPALLVAFTISQTKYARWAFVFFILGALGQVSLLNTFCHIHTPIAFSLLRAFHGIWVGLCFGAFFHVIVKKVLSFPPFPSFFPPPK